MSSAIDCRKFAEKDLFMDRRREVDLKTYPKRNQFNWFSTFLDPSYGFDVDINVDAVVALTKKRGDSFFPYFFYLVMKSVNSVQELRLRELKGHVYLYDVIHPTWTVMTNSGVYENVGCKMSAEFPVFYRRIKSVTDRNKKCEPNGKLDQNLIVKQPNVVFATCLPQLEIVGMRHPTPAGNHDNLSVPRILWDKYRKKEDGCYHLTLNITVSHTLVDGFPLAECFNTIKALALNPEKTFSK
jgi:chloramphenicol O-acetyltransferase type A